MRCGIAFHAADLISALPHAEHVKCALHYGKNVSEDCVLDADVSNVDGLRLLACAISKSDCDVVSLQHEFGIWGGRLGENIFSFLDELSKPIVSTLHTTFAPHTKNPLQTSILRRLIEQSSRVVVLTEASKRLVCDLSADSTEKVIAIPHGVPDAPFVPAPVIWPRDFDTGVSRNPLSLISLGFFRRDKGLEAILVALWMLKRHGLKFSYLIVGEPQSQFAGQDEYLCQVRGLIDALGLRGMVTVSVRFLTVPEQIQAIQDCHAGIFAYQDPTQSSSGTIPLVLSAGRPVICTPFEYAVTKRDELSGVTLAEGFGAHAIANAILKFLQGRSAYRRVTRSLYQATRAWRWAATGASYFKEYLVAARLN